MVSEAIWQTISRVCRHGTCRKLIRVTNFIGIS
uniref:Uncharacterized protein n=1 Tax=Arundo donax TaxID=35708 RepID=A0A0A9AWE4_ARUDO